LEKGRREHHCFLAVHSVISAEIGLIKDASQYASCVGSDSESSVTAVGSLKEEQCKGPRLRDITNGPNRVSRLSRSRVDRVAGGLTQDRRSILDKGFGYRDFHWWKLRANCTEVQFEGRCGYMAAVRNKDVSGATILRDHIDNPPNRNSLKV
jgi:hypothetical protein